jgi:hypothetical protein
VADQADYHTDFAAIKDSTFDGERIDGIYRGGGTGVRVLAVTSRRLMMVESTSWAGRMSVTSVPFSRVTSVGLLAPNDGALATSTVVGIRIQNSVYELSCDSEDLAREVHDLIVWTLVGK